MTAKKRLLIVAHAPSPNTLALREAALRGAEDPAIEGVEVLVKPPLEAGPEDLLPAEALLLGTTENLGYMAGAMKDFFDRSYYPCLEVKQGLPFALYIRAGHDGTGTRRAIQSITGGLKWRLVQDPLVLRGTWQKSFANEVEELSKALSAGLELGLF